jgi:1,4-dihydroxy-2-naphthoyl-CoA hydrolase
VKQPYGLTHGGVFATVAETLSSIGTMLGVSETGNRAVGMSNHTTFLRPVSDGTIHAQARPRHRGRSSWVWDVEVTDDGSRLCAMSRVTIAVRPAA